MCYKHANLSNTIIIIIYKLIPRLDYVDHNNFSSKLSISSNKMTPE